ncbi:MAG: hypothetical protein JNJ64_01485 [Flavobacteriales bacterium]|nr:hypothetical protein [Flavobacteriales bacterium]
MRSPLFILVVWCSIAPLAGQSYVQIGQDLDGEAPFDGSGVSVSLSADGLRVAVGAPSNSGNGMAAGHVRVFDDLGGTWVQVGSDLDGVAAGDAFGYVVLSGDGTRLAVGAPRNNDNGSDAGHVRAFDENGGSWTQVGATIVGEGATEWCGQAIALSEDGTRLAVGAQLNDDGAYQGGHIRVFDEVGGTWTQVGPDILGTAPNGELGKALALSADGQRLATFAEGHVRVFTFNGLAWTQLGADLIGEAPGDGFGWSIAFSADGTRLAVGAPFNDGNGADAGHARVYHESGGQWTQVGADLDGPAFDHWAGFKVALTADGARVMVSEPYQPGNTNQPGQVRVFEEVAGSWVQLGQAIVGEAPADYAGSGLACSTSGHRIAVGAHWNDDGGSNSGHVRVFQLDLETLVDGPSMADAVRLLNGADGARVHVVHDRPTLLRMFDARGACVLEQNLPSGGGAVHLGARSSGLHVIELRTVDPAGGVHRTRIMHLHP